MLRCRVSVQKGVVENWSKKPALLPLCLYRPATRMCVPVLLLPLGLGIGSSLCSPVNLSLGGCCPLF